MYTTQVIIKQGRFLARQAGPEEWVVYREYDDGALCVEPGTRSMEVNSLARAIQVLNRLNSTGRV